LSFPGAPTVSSSLSPREGTTSAISAKEIGESLGSTSSNLMRPGTYSGKNPKLSLRDGKHLPEGKCALSSDEGMRQILGGWPNIAGEKKAPIVSEAGISQPTQTKKLAFSGEATVEQKRGKGGTEPLSAAKKRARSSESFNLTVNCSLGGEIKASSKTEDRALQKKLSKITINELGRKVPV